MEIRTQLPLTPEEIKSQVPQIIEWLKEMQLTSLETMYGVSCGATSLEWVPMKVDLEDLHGFITRSEEQADIHFISTNLDFLEIVKTRWLAQGWSVYQGLGGTSREWLKFP
jgi:hypothetical protein